MNSTICLDCMNNMGMSEIIIIIVSAIIITEIFYLFIIKDGAFIEGWFFRKIISLLIGVFISAFTIMTPLSYSYEALLWTWIVILSIGVLFGINYSLRHMGEVIEDE